MADPTNDVARLTDAERRSLTDHFAFAYIPDPVLAAVEHIVADRVAAARADERVRVTHTVHVTARPIAEDVVWCDGCEEWVESGAPERAALTPPAQSDAGGRDE